jgi:c-di-GMP-binding flagellar brake protein YcgR
MKTLLKEKRLFPRIEVKLPFRYRIIGQKQVFATRIKDISASGAGFVAENFIAPSTDIRIEISIPVKIISPLARVVWSYAIAHSDRYRVGVEFDRISYKERCDLADYINGYLFKTLIKKG